MPETMTLLEWTEVYVKHRDLFEKKIASIQAQHDTVLVTQKDGESWKAIAAPELGDDVVAHVGAGRVLLVTRNLKANTDFVAQHWKKLAVNPGLKIIFVNVAKNEKWLLVPSTHDKVTEPATLKLGLQTMHEAVPEG